MLRLPRFAWHRQRARSVHRSLTKFSRHALSLCRDVVLLQSLPQRASATHWHVVKLYVLMLCIGVVSRALSLGRSVVPPQSLSRHTSAS